METSVAEVFTHTILWLGKLPLLFMIVWVPLVWFASAFNPKKWL